MQAARRFILGCQGLWPGRRWVGRPGTRRALHQSGLVQVDPLNVVGRSHDLALHARVWDYRPEHLDHLLYKSREFFDYGGTLYVLPMGELPYWRVHMARRAAEEKQRAFAAEHKQLLESLREDISSRGPVANRDYAGRGQRTRFRSDKDTARALRHLWLTGELMTSATITDRLIELSRALVGRARGGLAQVNIVVSMFFAGMNGSVVADTATHPPMTLLRVLFSLPTSSLSSLMSFLSCPMSF